jgi:hypothetical protein
MDGVASNAANAADTLTPGNGTTLVVDQIGLCRHNHTLCTFVQSNSGMFKHTLGN